MSNKYYKQLAQFKYHPYFKNLHPLIQDLHQILLDTFEITFNLLQAFKIVFWLNVRRYHAFTKVLVEIDGKIRKVNLKKIVRDIFYPN